MSTKKDMRRPDLVVPYQSPAASSSDAPDMGSTLSSTLPMAAIFTRNRYIGWASLVFAIQSWLGESEAAAQSSSSSPGYFTVGMSAMALAVTYLPVFMPPPPNTAGASGSAAAPPPVPA